MAVRAAILDVGQGDTAVVHQEVDGLAEAVIVDCCDARRVKRYLDDNGISRVYAVIVTHLHADHYSQVRTFLEACERWFPAIRPKLVYRAIRDRSVARVFADSPSRSLYRQLQEFVRISRVDDVSATSRPNPFAASAWQSVLEILYPSESQYAEALEGDFNNTSVVLRVRGSGSTLLLTGDIQADGLRICRNAKIDLRADLLKLPHHGAWTSSNGTSPDFRELLNAVQAKTALVSVGTLQRGRYNHPSEHVLEALRSERRWVLCTEATSRCLQNHLMPPDRRQPCAGTIVLDLSRTTADAVLSPSRESHRKTIDLLAGCGHQCWLTA